MVEPSVPPRYRLVSLPFLMTVSVLIRLLVNTANQLFTPFLTIIAAGLGSDVIRLGQLHIAVIYGGWLATDYIVGGTRASFTGPPAYTAYGVWGLGPVTALALLAAIVIMLRWVQEITDAQ